MLDFQYHVLVVRSQWNAMKKVGGTLRINLANYRELESFAQFGSEFVTNQLKEDLNVVAKQLKCLKQDVHELVKYAYSNCYDLCFIKRLNG